MVPPGRHRLSRLRPLAVGRATRIAAGVAALVGLAFVPWEGAATLGGLALALLGLSFLIGGLLANPGCELTALPNLFLRRDKKVHFV